MTYWTSYSPNLVEFGPTVLELSQSKVRIFCPQGRIFSVKSWDQDRLPVGGYKASNPGTHYLGEVLLLTPQQKRGESLAKF